MVLIERYGGISINHRVSRELGDASYSMYLIHPFVLMPLQRFVYPNSAGYPIFAKIGLFVFAAVFVSIASVLAFRYIERPMTRYLTKAYRGNADVSRARNEAS
jgi:peptidoglycan/LPS O-acetylase OafA/YrhL